MLGLKPGGELSVFGRTFNRCIGLCPTENAFYLSSLHPVWRFENLFTQGEQQDGGPSGVPRGSAAPVTFQVRSKRPDGQG